MAYESSPWAQTGGSLSDKSACKEYGLTKDEIYKAISSGELDCRENVMHGNPYFKLVRGEVEKYILKKYGKKHLEEQKLNYELSSVNTELRSLKKKTNAAEKRKKELTSLLEKSGD